MRDADFRKKLSPEQYAVLREKNTETPFSGALLHNKEKGGYKCAACGQEVFSSEHKFDSDSGWPSFYNVANNSAIKLVEDTSHGMPSSRFSRSLPLADKASRPLDRDARESSLLGMQRVEVTCANCGSHLGHVFRDAPQTPTGMRFCINSCALDFQRIKPTP